MIIVKLISGLGNQLFQYALGRQLAIQRKVPLLLDLSFYQHQQLRSFSLDNFHIDAAIATEQDVEKVLHIYKDLSLSGKIYRRIEQYLPKYKRPYFKEAEWWVYEPEVLRIRPDAYLEGYWQHYKYFTQLDPKIYQELTVRNTGPAVYDTLLDEIRQSGSSVSLHIRRGDYITDKEANNLMGVLPVAYYQEAISKLKEQVKDPTFFVFSDDIEWASGNLHLDASLRFVDTGSESRDYLDLNAMRHCSHHIIANSSFSWWGAFLNQNPGKVVVAPRKWVVPEEINNKINLQFPSWIKI